MAPQDKGYWSWVENHCKRDEHGDLKEPKWANPDVLGDRLIEEDSKAIKLREWLLSGGVKSLSPSQQIVFDWCFYRGKTEAEVSKILKCSQQNVWRIKEAIRKKLATVVGLKY